MTESKINKINVFNNELVYIKNERFLSNVKYLINLLPDYFFEIPASSTGKYHPSFALGNGGLIRHTKAAVTIAHYLLNNKSTNNFTNDEKDLIIISLLLHDSFKSGYPQEKYSRADHPLLVVNFLREHKEDLNFSPEEFKYLCDAIASHMGEYNTDYRGNVILPLPKTKEQRFVHMCDDLASKKFLNIKFDENNNVVTE